ncbi:hypothetical protein [Curtobacterium sp. MCJR17_043]|nr:hypothetical protein [Curtobacterium sp. MCJR17_043]WIB35756.1 hypothetical protein DEJ15_16875 [Curtobacterium sp. MCJR17_043]
MYCFAVATTAGSENGVPAAGAALVAAASAAEAVVAAPVESSAR